MREQIKASLAILLTGFALGQGGAADETGVAAKRVDRDERARRIFAREHPYVDTVFRPGEKLTFSVRYGPIRAGEATIELPEITVLDGDSCFHVLTTASSNDFFSTFFHVRDRVESFMSIEDLRPLRFEKHLREGGYAADQIVRFDHDALLAVYNGEHIYDILPGSHDILSAFFAVRARELAPGVSFDLECHADRKNYPLKTTVHRRERVSVPAGEFDCLVVEPVLRTPGLFKHEGTLTIWLSDDPQRIPVQMRSSLPIGAISVVLTDVAGRPDWEAGR